MITFLVLFLSMLALYLLLVAGSSSGAYIHEQLFTIEEIIAALILSLLTAAVARVMLGKAESRPMTNPGKLLVGMLWFPFYFAYFLYAMTIANLDVAYRVITGKIRPGIVRIKPGLKTALGRTFLANSITLTPGTLTVDIDDETGDLFIHWINVQDTKDEKEKLKGTSGRFSKWARRVTE